MDRQIAPIPEALAEYAARLEENLGTQKILGTCPLCRERPKMVYLENLGLRWHHECSQVPGWVGSLLEWVGIRKKLERGISYDVAISHLNFTRKFHLDEAEKRLEKKTEKKG